LVFFSLEVRQDYAAEAEDGEVGGRILRAREPEGAEAVDHVVVGELGEEATGG
jgi:hypothetical protein